MKFMNDKVIIHREIKPLNLLLKKLDNNIDYKMIEYLEETNSKSNLGLSFFKYLFKDNKNKKKNLKEIYGE